MARVLYLDDFRPTVTETMGCLICGLVHVLRHVSGTRARHFPCPGCDETASVPGRTFQAQ